MRFLITGGAGFMGSNFIRYMISKYPNNYFVNLDKLTYAGNLDNLRDIGKKSNYEFVKGDICDLDLVLNLFKRTDVVFNFAAASHVKNSIDNPLEFTKTNTFGAQIIFEATRRLGLERLVHISTDEVYGDVLTGSSKEEDPFSPTNPYSATKAAAEVIGMAYLKTYEIPLTIIRSCNNIGPFQYPEKILPHFITRMIDNRKVPLEGNGKNIRTYIYVDDFCNAVDIAFQKGKSGEIYNIGTGYEISNLGLTKKLLQIFDRDESLINFVKDRPFNDGRYSPNSSKIRSLGWSPQFSFEESLNKTVDWYRKNPDWWRKIYDRIEREERSSKK